MKIVGQMVCGPGEAGRYLKETLEEFKRLCDDVIVATCNATSKEKKLLDKYDFRHYEDNREWGRHQPDIKSDLLRRILLLVPDYILVLDADETIPTISSREVLEGIAHDRDSAFFYVVNLWNDPEHYSKTLSFWNVRFYKADPSKGVQFLRKPLHCGNAPPYFYNQSARSAYVPHILLHKGLMKPEDRIVKSTRYQQYDPYAIHKGREYYDALTMEGATGSEYNQEEVLKRIYEYCQSLERRGKS